MPSSLVRKPSRTDLQRPNSPFLTATSDESRSFRNFARTSVPKSTECLAARDTDLIGKFIRSSDVSSYDSIGANIRILLL